jgi:hypothetical protein
MKNWTGSFSGVTPSTNRDSQRFNLKDGTKKDFRSTCEGIKDKKVTLVKILWGNS